MNEWPHPSTPPLKASPGWLHVAFTDGWETGVNHPDSSSTLALAATSHLANFCCCDERKKEKKKEINRR